MIAEKLLLKTLENLRYGRLELVTPSGRYVFGAKNTDLTTRVIVEDRRFFSRVVFDGDDGAGDSWVDGDWWSTDLVSLIRIFVRNRDVLQGASPWSRWLSATSRGLNRIRHLLRRNTIAGSRRNIAAHYDLSNEFFRLFLDREMLYSCAIFENETDSLEKAQMHKLDHICRKLELGPEDHVLEIGTGWGAFAERAVRRYGCRVTTTTISRQQHAAAQERFARSGAAGNRIELLLEDYRKLKGRFSKIVSIEMFEAVGLDHYDDFFGACNRLLTPRGSMLIQTITMNEKAFPNYHRGSDWIQRRIFPGAELGCLSEIMKSAGRAGSLNLTHAEDIGPHYALTLQEWRRRFHEAGKEVLRLNFDKRFVRMWDYYLAYCEGAFRERYIGDAQLLFTRMHGSATRLNDPRPASAVPGREEFHEPTLHTQS
jgi:cyclopropane-fatty-acyl-phospholipid synthase